MSGQLFWSPQIVLWNLFRADPYPALSASASVGGRARPGPHRWACACPWAVRGAHRGLSACLGAMSDSGSDVDGREEDKRSQAGFSEDTGGSFSYVVVVLKAFNATSNISQS